MVDENFDRTYQAGRAELNASLERAFGRIGGAIGNSLQVLHDIQWNAPWNSTSKRSQCG
jgi:hypothetical protein